MKLLCVIDSLNPGGAQRQLVTIAVGLKKRGHDVRFLVYYPPTHFLPLLESGGIPCQVLPSGPHWRRLLDVRRELRCAWQDVVLAFLEGPCLYSELARFPRQPWGLVVGERAADPRINGGASRRLRLFHRFADAVVTNSHSNRLMLEKAHPRLSRKLTTIYNVVDLDSFRPQAASGPGGWRPRPGMLSNSRGG